VETWLWTWLDYPREEDCLAAIQPISYRAHIRRARETGIAGATIYVTV
jgi:PII-like signaling protein